MNAYCSTNKIQLLHGTARTPTTQGLGNGQIVRSKKTIRTMIMSTCGLQISKWCKYTMQSSYIMNMSYHRAINMTPYEAVFHIKAKRELLDHNRKEGPGKQKRKEIQETQKNYSSKMIKQSEAKTRKKLYKVDDSVSI